MVSRSDGWVDCVINYVRKQEIYILQNISSLRYCWRSPKKIHVITFMPFPITFANVCLNDLSLISHLKFNFLSKGLKKFEFYYHHNTISLSLAPLRAFIYIASCKAETYFDTLSAEIQILMLIAYFFFVSLSTFEKLNYLLSKWDFFFFEWKSAYIFIVS